MTNPKPPAGMETMRVLGMTDAEGNDTEDEARATSIEVETTDENGQVTHTLITKTP